MRPLGYTRTDNEIDITPEAYAKQARDLVKQGYTALKFDPFLHAIRYDQSMPRDVLHRGLEVIKSVRNAVGNNVDICVESHGIWNAPSALKLIRKLADYDPLFFEEPVPPENVDVIAKVRSLGDVPIYVGERVYTRYGFREILEKQAADIIMPDVVRTGGISELKKIATMAEAYYVPIAPHNVAGPVATLASLHVVASVPNFLILEFISSERDAPWRDEIITEPIKFENGFLGLPTKPGLGVELVEEKLSDHLSGKESQIVFYP